MHELSGNNKTDKSREMTIGQRIKLSRKANRMTQEELAGKIGTTKQTIYKYENDVVKIPLNKIEAIARVLQVSPAYLAGWESAEVE